jgi:hypothetical protein
MSEQCGERTAEPIRADRIDGGPRSCGRGKQAGRRIDPDGHPNLTICLKSFGERTAEAIRADGIYGGPRLYDHNKRTGRQIDPRRSFCPRDVSG